MTISRDFVRQARFPVLDAVLFLAWRRSLVCRGRVLGGIVGVPRVRFLLGLGLLGMLLFSNSVVR